MKYWIIPVTYEVYGTVGVQADTLEEAMDIALNDGTIPFPDDPEFVDGSWDLGEHSIEDIRRYYNDGEEDDPPSGDEETNEDRQHGLRAYMLPPNASIEFIGQEDQKEYEEENPDEMFGFLFCNGVQDNMKGG